ncbi:MAG: MarR family transcriptional regulator [Candidatus Gracilibacteria bacterium]|nr:MarR family transcriptional regulator [Candidatus Gracilibacteria bacterium]
MNKNLDFLMRIEKLASITRKRFDAGLNGLGWSDFLILHYLANTPDQKLRRIDLAERVGVTASGVTRLLLPMEKIGLISRDIHPTDARVSYVLLAPGGYTKYREGLERAELALADMRVFDMIAGIDAFSEILTEVTKHVAYK